MVGVHKVTSRYNRQESHTHTVTVHKITASGGWLVVTGSGKELQVSNLKFEIISGTKTDRDHAQMTAPLIVVGDSGVCSLTDVTVCVNKGTEYTHAALKCPVIDAVAGKLTLTHCAFADVMLTAGTDPYDTAFSLLRINPTAG